MRSCKAGACFSRYSRLVQDVKDLFNHETVSSGSFGQASDTAPCEGLSILPMDVHTVGVFFILIPEN